MDRNQNQGSRQHVHHSIGILKTLGRDRRTSSVPQQENPSKPEEKQEEEQESNENSQAIHGVTCEGSDGECIRQSSS